MNAEDKNWYRAKAQEIYVTDDIEIGNDAKFSDARPEGVWVSAWVWVPAREEDK